MLTAKQENDLESLPEKWRQRARNLLIEKNKLESAHPLRKQMAEISAQLYENCAEEIERILYRYQKKK
jgi:hypothetical protein